MNVREESIILYTPGGPKNYSRELEALSTP